MKGPYTFTVSLAVSQQTGPVRLADMVRTGANSVKRLATREMRRTVKDMGVGPDGIDRAKGEVRDGDGNLVKQVEAYQTRSGAIKVRDLEL